jgi:hypothetical protein
LAAGQGPNVPCRRSRKKSPEADIAPGLPHTLKDIGDTHTRQLAYSGQDLAHPVALLPLELEATYGIGTAGRGATRGRLRIVLPSVG